MFKKSISIGIIVLFLFCNISFTTLSDENSGNLSGKTLYVGGSGEGNYTKIQDAIDDASDGDTVFVYSGTYYVNVNFIEINNSIELRGQSRNKTVIKALADSVLFINKSNVSISNFTFENFWILCGPTKIEEAVKKFYNIEISNNRIKNSICLFIENCNNVKISGNTFSPKKDNLTWGILSNYNSNAKIENNVISGFMVGLSITDGNVVKNNFIQNNIIGLQTWVFDESLYPCVISENNFINNVLHSRFGLLYSSLISKYISSICKNNIINNYMSKDKDNFHLKNKNLLTYIKWNGNYWDNWMGIGPKYIFGNIFFLGPLGPFFPLPMVNLDWHPAKEPYDIPFPEV